jgi:hypothetical protein
MARQKIPQRRLGKNEQLVVKKVLGVIEKFKVHAADKPKHETTINNRLIKRLQTAVPAVRNKVIGDILLVNERYRPECSLAGGGEHELLAVECKRLTTLKRAKAVFKEGLAQALIYLQRYKVVFFVLYDFTPGKVYKKKFGVGNRSESRLRAALRRDLRLYLVVRSPP